MQLLTPLMVRRKPKHNKNNQTANSETSNPFQALLKVGEEGVQVKSAGAASVNRIPAGPLANKQAVRNTPNLRAPRGKRSSPHSARCSMKERQPSSSILESLKLSCCGENRGDNSC